jgi:hypothetical protein
MKNAIIAAVVASFALIWAGVASADTYVPIQISSATINAQQQLTVTWVVPPSGGLSLMNADWKLLDTSTGTWNDYTSTADWNTYAGGSYTWTLTQPQAPPADASASMNLSVQVHGWDAHCTWLNHGILFYGCENYSPWTNFNLTSSCSRTLITAGHYIIKKRGHYVYVKKHHRRVRVWVKRVRVWVKPVYSNPSCVWVNA